MKTVITILLIIVTIDAVRIVPKVENEVPKRMIESYENKQIDTTFREYLVRKENIKRQSKMLGY